MVNYIYVGVCIHYEKCVFACMCVCVFRGHTGHVYIFLLLVSTQTKPLPVINYNRILSPAGLNIIKEIISMNIVSDLENDDVFYDI